MATTTSLLCLFGSVIVIMMIFLASSIRIVQEDRRLSVYRVGRFLGDKGPGVVMLIPIIDRGIVKELGGMEKVSSRGNSGRCRRNTHDSFYRWKDFPRRPGMGCCESESHFHGTTRARSEDHP